MVRTTLGALGTLLLTLALGCEPGPVPDDDGGDGGATDDAGDGDGDGDGDTTTDTGTTDGGETCLFHCFSAPPVSFPYNVDPVDEDGDQVPVGFECVVEGGDSMDLNGTFFPIDEEACVSTQATAEVVNDLGVCDPGPVVQPPPAAWVEWVNLYASRTRNRCRSMLTGMGCLDGQPGDVPDASEVCAYWLENQLKIDTLAVAPQLEEIDPVEGEPPAGGSCDYAELACE